MSLKEESCVKSFGGYQKIFTHDRLIVTQTLSYLYIFQIINDL